MVVTGQVKVTVVGQVEHRIPVGNGFVGDAQAVLLQGIGDGYIRIARETLVAMGTVQREGDGRSGVIGDLPEAVFPVVGATVQIVVTFVGAHDAGGIVQNKTSVFHPVGVAADGSTEKGGAGDIMGRIIEAQNHIGKVTVMVRDIQLYQRCT